MTEKYLDMHPVSQSETSIKQAYTQVLAHSLRKLGCQDEVCSYLYKAYCDAFLLEAAEVKTLRDSPEQLDQIVNSGYHDLLLLDLLFLIKPFTSSIVHSSYFVTLAKKMGFNNRQYNSIRKIAALPSSNLHPSVAVVATMSAGKSTLLNAIIGKRVFPSANRACTAKIVTLQNEPHLNWIIGDSEKNRKTLSSWEFISNQVQLWNEDPSVASITIQGKLNHNSSLVEKPFRLVDTPGVNYARDITHGLITESFVSEGQFQAVIVVLNASLLATNDEATLLKQVISNTKDKPVLFVLNKADQLDPESGETTATHMKLAVAFLKEHGVERPIVIPASARAASLIKASLLGTKLSRKEERDLNFYMDWFGLQENDLTKHAIGISSRRPKNSPTATHMTSNSKLNSALERTGILLIEHWIAQHTKRKKVKIT